MKRRNRSRSKEALNNLDNFTANFIEHPRGLPAQDQQL